MRILQVSVAFPSAGSPGEGQGRYLACLARALARRPDVAGVHVLALRFRDQPPRERIGDLEVERVALPDPQPPDVFRVYEPPWLARAAHVLARAALEAAHRIEPGAVELHGYETGEARVLLETAGIPILPVVHYLVAQETVHDLAVADDPVRRDSFDSPFASAVGRTCPPALRPGLVAATAATARWTRHLPAPTLIRQQILKLHLERRLLGGTGPVMAVGRSFAASIAALHPHVRRRLTWTHAGIPEEPPPAGPGWPLPDAPGSLRVALVGRPTGQKGWDYAAEALQRIEAADPAGARRIQVVAAGGLGDWTGPYSAWSRRVADRFLALRHVRVALTGALPVPAVQALLRDAHLLLAPSVFEPFGLVLVEAMAAGCMVLASDADGPTDVLRAPWAVRVPFGEPARRVEGLVEGIQRIRDLGPEEVTRRGEAARAAAAAYTWDGCARGHREALP